MLTATREQSAEQVLASETEKGTGPFLCPECRRDVLLKKGRVVIHHFAHVPPVTCQYGLGETIAHQLCKLQIYELICSVGATGGLEAKFGNARADVWFQSSQGPVAVEVQRSNLSAQKLAERTSEYARIGMPVLWVLPGEAPANGSRMAPRDWQKALHAMYFGRLYFWNGKSVTPVHMADHLLWVEDREWHVSGGGTDSAGGYHKPSRRWRKAVTAESVSLFEFKSTLRDAWSSKRIEIPACKLWMDQKGKWWT